MSIFKKTAKDTAEKAGSLFGDAVSQNAHQATSEMVNGMGSFLEKAAQVKNVDFDISKGNLFEYIEAAKFNADAASIGEQARAVVTDAVGRPHDKVDIEIVSGGKVVEEIQAKASINTHAAVQMQAGIGEYGKYDGMKRLILKASEDDGERQTSLREAKRFARERGDATPKGKDSYYDAADNLNDEIAYNDAKSGGTTIDELRDAKADPSTFAKHMEHHQLAQDMKQTSTNMAIGAAVSTGMISSITNLFEVYKDEKEWEDALIDITKDTGKAAVRGAATGAISSGIRYEGYKAGSKLLSDSTAATVMAGAMIDGGVALFSYAKGDISGEELQGELVNTTFKASATIYFTKAVTAITGTANPFLPIAVYSTASYVVTCTREILKNAELNVEEYQRLAAILDSSTQTLRAYKEQVRENMALAAENQRKVMNDLLQTFDYNLETGENYDRALMSIVAFANETGIALQHVAFNDFEEAMNSDEVFILE